MGRAFGNLKGDNLNIVLLGLINMLWRFQIKHICISLTLNTALYNNALLYTISFKQQMFFIFNAEIPDVLCLVWFLIKFQQNKATGLHKACVCSVRCELGAEAVNTACQLYSCTGHCAIGWGVLRGNRSDSVEWASHTSWVPWTSTVKTQPVQSWKNFKLLYLYYLLFGIKGV